MKNNIIKNKTPPDNLKSRTITILRIINSFTNFLQNYCICFPSFLPSLSFYSLPSFPFLNNLVQKPFGGTEQGRFPRDGREVTATWHGVLELKRDGYGQENGPEPWRRTRASMQEGILGWGVRDHSGWDYPLKGQWWKWPGVQVPNEVKRVYIQVERCCRDLVQGIRAQAGKGGHIDRCTVKQTKQWHGSMDKHLNM